jgi:hypothetical protein
MSILIKFLEENEHLLTDCEKRVITNGLVVDMHISKRRSEQELKMPFPDYDINELIEMASVGNAMLMVGDRRCGEKNSGDLLVLLWEYIMPKLKLLDREHTLPSGRRIDILAEKENGGLLVIELKNSLNVSAERSAVKQARRYAVELEDLYGKPVETLVISRSGVGEDSADVLIWDEIGIFNDAAYAPDSFDAAELAEICLVHNEYPRLIDGRLAYSRAVLFDYMHGGI